MSGRAHGNLAERIGDPFALGVSSVNLSSLYLQTWDIDSAVRAAEDGVSNSEEIRSRKDGGAQHGGEQHGGQPGSALNTSYRLPLLLVRDYNIFNPRSYSGPMTNDRCRCTGSR